MDDKTIGKNYLTDIIARAGLVGGLLYRLYFSHNDIHAGNLLNVDGNLKLIDFDFSNLGFRAFDILHFFSNMTIWPDQNLIETFINNYLGEYNLRSSVKISGDLLWNEICYHMPFVLLGQMLRDAELWIEVSDKKYTKNVF